MGEIFDMLFSWGGTALHLVLGTVLCVAGGYLLFSARSVGAKILGFVLLAGGLVVGWPVVSPMLGF